MAAENSGRSGSTPPEDAGANGGEFRGGPSMGSAVISGASFATKSVVYYDVEGVAIVEGDIALGTVEEVKQATAAARRGGRGRPQHCRKRRYYREPVPLAKQRDPVRNRSESAKPATSD